MPEHERSLDRASGPSGRDRVVLVGAVIAVGLGFAAAAGPVFRGTGTTASVGDAAGRSIAGGVVGLAACALALALIRIWMARYWSHTRPFAITAAACAIGLGALVGASTTPDESQPQPAAAGGGADTVIPTGSVDADGVVVAVDRDADGEADTFDGRPVLGFDIDDDDVVDGYLRPCDRTADPLVEEREGYVAIDLRCDSVVDDYLPYDEERLLTEVRPSAAPPQDDGVAADTLITAGLVIMLLALLVALGFFLSQKALRAPPLDRQFVHLSRPGAVEPDEQIDVDEVAQLLQHSLDDVLLGADPRIAIRIAFGTLLDGLAAIGLRRRPEEGPAEHIERCLRAADLPAGPVRELLALFALARFSAHPITEDHRARAVAALHAAIASVRQLEHAG